MSSRNQSQIKLPYEEIEGRRRNSRTFVANGYGYLLKKVYKNTVAYLGCVTGKSCPATALLYESQKILVPKRDHNHPPTPQEFVKIKFIASLKRKVEHTDLKLSDFFNRELEKANVKNAHDLGIDFRKIEPTLYNRRVSSIKANKKHLRSRVDPSSSYGTDDTDLETIGALPPFNYEQDTNDVNMDTVCEVHAMEVGVEGSNEEDSCSKEVHTSEEPINIDNSAQDIQAAASDSNNHSLQHKPFSATAARASPEPRISLYTEQASGRHTVEKRPATAAPDFPLSSGSERYQLRHNNHLSLVLNQLAEDEAFMDVTLTAEGRQVKAHKNVLSAVSPYFSKVLRCNPCQHPIIIMPNDVRYAQLVQIITFIYRGEVNVPATELMPLMKVGDQLLITGLSQKGNKDPHSDLNLPESEDPAHPSSSPTPRPSSSPTSRPPSSPTPRPPSSPTPRPPSSPTPRPPSLPTPHPSSLPTPHPSSSPTPRPPSSPRETSRRHLDAAGTSGQQTKPKKPANNALDGEGSGSMADQATIPVTDASLLTSVESAQDSDEDDSDGFDDEFLDRTPVGSPSNDTPVIDVDLSLIKEENFNDESKVRITDSLQEDPLHDPYPSSSDLNSVPENNLSSKATSSGTPRITRRSATINNSASTSSSYNLNPVVMLKQVCSSTKASNTDVRLEQPGSSGNSISLGYTNLSSVEHDPYVCPYCRRAFSDLTDHFTNHHITQPAFICSRCCRVYTDKAVFIGHRAKCN